MALIYIKIVSPHLITVKQTDESAKTVSKHISQFDSVYIRSEQL